MNGRLLGALSHADERLLRALVLKRRPAADRAMRAVTRLGDPVVVVALTLALALAAPPELEGAGVLSLWTLVLSHGLVQILKHRVCRRRPTLPVGFGFLIEPQDRFSFPSGHAAAGLSVVLPMAVAIGGGLGAFVLLFGLVVGLSRCYLGVHYPGDVFAGWSLAGLAYALASAVTGVSL